MAQTDPNSRTSIGNSSFDGRILRSLAFVESLLVAASSVMNVRTQVHFNGVRILDSADDAEPLRNELERDQDRLTEHYEIEVAGHGLFTIDYTALSLESTDLTWRSPHEDFTAHQKALFKTMADISKELLTPTLDNHRLIIELTHELSLLMLSIGLFAQQIIEFVDESQGNDSLHALREALTLNSYLFAEAQLGLYTVRNFLSHFSESSDRRSIKPRFEEIDVRLLLSEMIDVYGRHAKFKEVSINVEGLADLPKIRGIGSELRRAFHNVLNNAVKYSYHSVSIAQRSIRIRAKVPYDPGFKRRRFALSFENYGLGTTRKRPAEFLSPASAANRRSMKYLSDLVLACQRFAK